MVGISIENCHIELPKRIEKWTYCKYEVNIIFNILETRFYLLGACLKSNIFFPAWNPAMVSYIILSIKYVYIYEYIYIYIWYIHISIYIYTFIDIQLQSRHIYIYIDAIYIYIYHAHIPSKKIMTSPWNSFVRRRSHLPRHGRLGGLRRAAPRLGELLHTPRARFVLSEGGTCWGFVALPWIYMVFLMFVFLKV
jgi:hypothetical protein